MQEIARKGLERLRERFAVAEDHGITLACLLIQEEGQDEDHSDWQPPTQNWFVARTSPNDKSVSHSKDTYRDPYGPRTSDGLPYFTDHPVLIDGKPLTNSAGTPLAFLHRIQRSIHCLGLAEAHSLFRRLNAEAARCLEGLPRHIQRLFPIEVQQSPGEQRWIYTTFECAWIRPEGSSLPDAPQMAWKENFAIPYHQLNDGPFPEITNAISRNRWFAEIDDLFSASRATIDLLLHVWDSVPAGWVGIRSPKDISGLCRYLEFAKRELARRSAQHPQFAMTLPESEINGIPARYWWPYVEYVRAQVRTAVIATDNVAAWLRANNFSIDSPSPIDFGTSLLVALRTVDDWGRLVEGLKNGSVKPLTAGQIIANNLTPEQKETLAANARKFAPAIRAGFEAAREAFNQSHELPPLPLIVPNNAENLDKAPDGPIDPNHFQFKGKVVELPYQSWLALKVVWGKPEVSQDDFFRAAVRDHARDATEGAVRGYRDRINQALTSVGYPQQIGLSKGRIVWK